MAYNDRTRREIELCLSSSARGIVLGKLPNSYVSMDLETTGLDPNTDGIVEIAGVRVIDGEVDDVFQTLVNTKARLSREASAINGITRAMLKDAPNTEDAMASFIEWSDGLPMLGYNAIRFDKLFVERACTYTAVAAPTKWYDVMDLAKKVYGRRMRLVDLCARCKVENERAHRALSDAMATHVCYQHMRSLICEVTTDARNFPKPSKEGPLAGETVCFTGDRPTVARHELMELVVEKGGSLSNSVTLKTTILVKVSEVTTSKTKKATEYSERTGIRVVSLNDFLAMAEAQDMIASIYSSGNVSSVPMDERTSAISQSTETAMAQPTKAQPKSTGNSGYREIAKTCGCVVLIMIICFFILASCISSCMR